MTVFKSFYNFLGNYGRCCVAVHLTALGDHAGAQQIMMEDFQGWI